MGPPIPGAVDPRPNSQGAKLQTIHMAGETFRIRQYYVITDHMDAPNGSTELLGLEFLYPSLLPAVTELISGNRDLPPGQHVIQVTATYHSGYKTITRMTDFHNGKAGWPRNPTLDFEEYEAYSSGGLNIFEEYSWKSPDSGKPFIQCDKINANIPGVRATCNAMYQFNPHMAVDMTFDHELLHDVNNLKNLVDEALSYKSYY